jgi:ABC-type transport system involved in multi-copper enzyme maturation permease subunit
VITIARLTVREAARRRILWTLVALSILSIVLVAWGVDRLVQLAREHDTSELQIQVGVSQVLILVAFMFSFVLAMTAAFLGAPAISADLESGIALALLARPLRRSSLIVGRWLGLAAVTSVYALGSGLAALAAVSVVSGYRPPNPLVPVTFLAAEALILMTFTMLLSTRLPAIAGGAVAVVVYGLAWMAGVMGGIAPVFHADSLARVADAVRYLVPSDGLWRGVIFGLEPPVLIALAQGNDAVRANPFYASTAPEPLFLAWCVAWVGIVLGLAVLSLNRREI